MREVTGIGPNRAERIITGWAEQKIIREIMLFLHSNGVGTSRAVRIYKTSADAIRLISEKSRHWRSRASPQVVKICPPVDHRVCSGPAR